MRGLDVTAMGSDTRGGLRCDNSGGLGSDSRGGTGSSTVFHPTAWRCGIPAVVKTIADWEEQDGTMGGNDDDRDADNDDRDADNDDRDADNDDRDADNDDRDADDDDRDADTDDSMMTEPEDEATWQSLIEQSAHENDDGVEALEEGEGTAMGEFDFEPPSFSLHVQPSELQTDPDDGMNLLPSQGLDAPSFSLGLEGWDGEAALGDGQGMAERDGQQGATEKDFETLNVDSALHIMFALPQDSGRASKRGKGKRKRK
ncbi:unnamed protein product [Closterium sp. Yama58-4]|nr:unnamed protein product [Closterium sp. Yama58-4]